MSQPETKVADVDVKVGQNLLRRGLLRGFAIALLPAIAAFAALLLLREPQLEQQLATQLGDSMAVSKASDIDRFNQSMRSRLTAIGSLPEAALDSVASVVVPEASTVRAVPLGDTGTVNLDPGDYRISSAVEIDLVRRAFNRENPEPEAINQGGTWRLVYATAFDNGVKRGVLLAELPVTVLAEQLQPNPQGRYVMVQQANNAADRIIGAPLNTDMAYASAQIGRSQWFIRYQPEKAWLQQLLQGGYWTLAAAGTTLIGILLGAAATLRSIPALLRKEVDRVLESAENRTALQLNVPPLLPMVRLLRQMALLTRRQLITSARKTSETSEAQEPAVKADVAATPDTEALAAELTIDSDTVDEREDGIPAHIFRSADIRGRTDDELTEQLTERICQTIAVLAQRRGIQTLAVAYDGRPSSERLRVIVVKTLLAAGRDVVELGQAPSPLLYFATHESEYDSGIMITGGHSGDAINGLRIVFQRQLVTGQGIQDILSGVRDGLQEQGKGRTVKLDVQGDYLDKIALDVGVALPLKIVVDCNLGAAATVIEEVFSAMGCEAIIYNKPGDAERPADGWRLQGALDKLGQAVVEAKADIGILFDSDGDRVHTVTNTGQTVATDQLMMVLARDLLDRNPGADIVYDVQCTRHFAPFVTRSGGRAIISRSGHANVRAKMAQAQAILGGEFGGHIYLTDRWYPFDDGIYAAARLVELLSTASETYQELVSALPQYVSSDEITVAMEPREQRQLIRDLTTEPNFPGSRVTTLDGLRIDYADSWGLVQASSSEDALVFRFEGNDQEAMDRVQAVLRRAVKDKAPDLALPF